MKIDGIFIIINKYINMAKKSPEMQNIEEELKREYEQYKSKVLPKFQKKARGKLRRLQKSINKLKPLKVKNFVAQKAESEIKSKLTNLQAQISNAKKRAASDKSRIKSLTQEIKKLKKEIPILEKNVHEWSRDEKSTLRKHKRAAKVLGKFQKAVVKLEKRKDKAVHDLQKYFQ